MATFMVNGPPAAPLVAVGAAFYGSEEGAVDDAMDEMDTDHFNELDKIFDLPYPADGNDPFATPGPGAGGAAAGGASSSAGVNAAASMMVQPPYLQSHRMDWSREEDASYHTAVDATCHSAVDASYHHVDASMHSHSVVDASMHSHSVMDASGHDSLADYSQHGEYEYGPPGKGEPRFMEHSCEACKRSKKRCNRRNPCQICTARGIKCVPQVRGPGRPPGSKSNRGSSSSSSSSLASSSSRREGGSGSSSRGGASATAAGSANGSTHGPSSLTRTSSGNGLAHSHGTTDSERSSSAGSTASSRGRGGGLRGPPPRDPWHCRFFFEAARHCKEAFLKAWHENELDTAKCILIRNMWAKTAARFPPGVDITFGISEQVQEAVGPPPPASAPPATSPATRSKSHAAQLAKELTHPGSREGMGVWCLPEELRKLDDGCSMLAAFMHIKDETLVYTDEKFAATFMGREEIATKVENLAVLPILLLAEIFHPDDLPDVYAAIGAHWFRKRQSLPPGDELTPEDCTGGLALQGEASWICKCVDKRNNEFLALARYRAFVAPPDGYPGAALLAIRPLQPSKYLGDPDNAAAFRRASARPLLRDTLGALPTHMEHGEYDNGDAAFRPLRRGTTVLSAEAGGPQPVPGAPVPQQPQQQQQQQQQHLGGSLHGGAPHQGGMSWGGMAERQQRPAQQQQQAHPHSYHAGGGGGLADVGMDTSHTSHMSHSSHHGGGLDSSRTDGRMSFAPASAPAGPVENHQQHGQHHQEHEPQQQHHQQQQQQQHEQLTEEQMFLLQGGPLTMPRGAEEGEEPLPGTFALPSLQTHRSAPPASGGMASLHQVSPEHDADGVSSVGTDLEQYGSSPSPEPSHHMAQQQLQMQQQAMQAPAPLAHSRSSPALANGGGWAPQQPPQQAQQPPQPAVLTVPAALAASMPRPILHAQVSDDTVPIAGGALAGRISHSSSGNELDVSCHGPHDPNGYGGLQWTPAPLSNIISSIGGVLGAAKKSIVGGNKQQPQAQAQPQQAGPAVAAAAAGGNGTDAGDMARSL